MTSSFLILIVSFKISSKLQIWNFEVSIWAMWLNHSSLQFTWRQIDINSIELSTQSLKFIALSSEINNFSVFFLVWWFRQQRCIIFCSSCSSISICHKVSSQALLFLNLQAASAQFCFFLMLCIHSNFCSWKSYWSFRFIFRNVEFIFSIFRTWQ